MADVPGGPANDSIANHLGPRMSLYLAKCSKESPQVFWTMWVTAFLGGIILCSLVGAHKRDIDKRCASLLKIYYTRIVFFAPVLGLTALSALFAPRTTPLMHMLSMQMEAVVFGSFGTVLMLLLCKETHESLPVQEADTSTMGERVIEALNRQGPQPHFGVPPFGCCFRKCLPHHLLKPSHLLLARAFMRQYAFTVLVSGLLGLWLALASDYQVFSHVNGILNKVVKLSSFICIYGLFILYKCTHDMLEHYRPTAKFVSLKIIVLLMNFQELIISPIVKKTSNGKSCLVNGDHDEEYGQLLVEHMVTMYLTVWESILVAMLVRRAFPASDLPDSEVVLYHAEEVEIQWQQMRTHKKGADVSDCSTSDEEEGSQPRPQD
eukprot:CAMPEP_0206424558 /NCGR_PEP_ID=MMETSP0324_2-20121206/3296_1 /ASSEMBLY_ACC=CAM_ASM_000836 /TAXON_ID=2866 /ORGANISM="Crypthecodinium cohnii, Strain Seligo" /LENGTH=377 /DNA_ID=CAMNT_0053889229 /DNA_START=31 /DNA_END=1164 /DNA_ORIENTATION=+